MHLISPAHEAKNVRILILDDEESTVVCLTHILERAGFTVIRGVHEPAEAIRRFSELQPDLVLLDWLMYPISGEEALLSLREKVPAEELLPVVVLTGDDCPETRHAALEGGATEFLTKPLDPAEMLLRIRNLVRLRQLHLATQSQNRDLETQVKQRTQQLERALAELREIQQQAIQQERLHALGTMAAGIAHDFNNTLMVIRGYTEMFLDEPLLCQNAERVRDCLGTIGSASAHAGEIVRRLREFYRPVDLQEEERLLVNLNDLVQEVVALSLPRWQTQPQARGVTIELTTQFLPVPLIAASPTELREVMMNLIFNAVDAMPEGGHIVVRTGVEEGNAFFEVEDSGSGMTEQVRRHCLEPFYSTKGAKGTGLGLSIVYGIIRRHRGLIRINSQLERGTQFTIVLPIADVVTIPLAEEVPAPSTRPLSVLLVDDQPSVRDVLIQYLRRDGHMITTAEDGYDALEKFYLGRFDLVMTDRAMPRMNGDQLAVALKDSCPLLPILMLTACGEECGPKPAAVDLLLLKPISLPALRNAIHQVAGRIDPWRFALHEASGNAA